MKKIEQSTGYGAKQVYVAIRIVKVRANAEGLKAIHTPSSLDARSPQLLLHGPDTHELHSP